MPAAMAALGALIRCRELANTFWLAIGDGSGKLIFFLANLYLARTLHPAAYGVFAVAQSLTFYAWQATDLGTSMHGVREVARHRRDTQSTVSALQGLRVVAGATGFAIAGGILWLWPLAPGTRLVFAGASIYLLSRAFYPDYAVKGLERFRTLAVGSLCAALTFLGAALLLVHGPAGLPDVPFIWSCSWFAGAVALSAYLHSRARLRVIPAFHPRAWLRHLRPSLHFALTGGLTLVYDTLPILLVAAIFGTARTGTFSAIYKLMISLTGVGFLIPTALYPVLSDHHANDFPAFVRVHKRLRNVMMTGGLLASVAGMVFAGPIVMLLLGRDYITAAGVFRILSADLLCYAGRFTYGIAIGASGNQKYYTIVSLIGLAVLGLTFLPASRLGLPGEALSVVLADASVAAGLAFILHRKVTMDPRARHCGIPSGVTT